VAHQKIHLKSAVPTMSAPVSIVHANVTENASAVYLNVRPGKKKFSRRARVQRENFFVVLQMRDITGAAAVAVCRDKND